MSNTTFTDTVEPFSGQDVTISSAAGIAPNGDGGDVLITPADGAGTGRGGDVTVQGGSNPATGDGGNIVIQGGVPTAGTQGSISFSALGTPGPTAALQFNDASNLTLSGSFSATSIVGAFNELISSIVNTFLGLTDTPSTYAGQANNLVNVNAGQTALEFNTLTTGTNPDLAITLPTSLELGSPDLSDFTTRVAAGGHVLVQSGTFTLTSTITIPADTTIEGSGSSQTIFTKTGALQMFSFNNNVTFKNCQIDGNAQTGALIDLNASTGCTIENCLLTNNATTNFINIQNNPDTLTITDCTFTSGTAQIIAGSSINDLIISNCQFANTAGTRDINLSTMQNALIANNVFQTARGLQITSASHLAITDNVIQAMTGSYVITADNITIANNQFSDVTGTPINLTSGTDVVINANTFDNISADVIIFAGDGGTISNNTINNGSANGISLTSIFTETCIVTSNTIKNTTTAIDITGALNSTISNNELSANTTGISAANTGSDLSIVGNLIQDNIGNGITSISAGTITGNTLLNNGNGTLYNINIQNNSQPIIIEGNRLSPNNNLNYNIGTGNDDAVIIKTNTATSTYSSPGAINPYDDIITISLAGVNAFTLADLVQASAGHQLRIFNTTGVSINTISPTTFIGFTDVSLDANENATLEWDGNAWHLLGKSSALTTSSGAAPYFLGTGIGQTISGLTPVTFNTTVSSSGVTHNSGTGVFNFDQPGFYQVSTNGRVSFTAANQTAFFELYIEHSANTSIHWGSTGIGDINISAGTQIHDSAMATSATIRIASTSESVRILANETFSGNVPLTGPPTVQVVWINPI